jgi:hypothetical protein
MVDEASLHELAARIRPVEGAGRQEPRLHRRLQRRIQALPAVTVTKVHQREAGVEARTP